MAVAGKRGKIKTVFCKNFVTYSECIFHPTEYLNVIIGPNGTGKSTLVAAIVLGLGGEPKILGRSNSIGDYVKNGCENAEIIVEIYSEDDNATKFHRAFDLKGKSQFSVDENVLSQKMFIQAVNAYKIQIGNLCQFLPQDKVQDFAKMNSQEILVNTINSICEPEVTENLIKLKELRADQDKGNIGHRTLMHNLEDYMRRIEALKEELDKFNARKDVQEKLNVCSAKKLRLEGNEIQSKITECENDVKLAKQNLHTYESEYKAATQRQLKIDSITSSINQDIQEKDRILKLADENKCQIVKKIEHLASRIHQEKSKYEKRKSDAKEMQNELSQETKMLHIYTQDLKNMRSEETSDSNPQQRIKECENKIEIIKEESKRLNQDHRNLRYKIDESVPEIQSLKSQLESLENLEEIKLDFLKSKFPDVYKAVKWLGENMNMFEGKVYRPIILEINVTKPDFSKYLENTISMRDLLAFSCESTKDLSLLITELCTKQKLAVNAFHAPAPDDSIFTSKVPIDHIRRYGFESYLIDMVNGPRPILGYLCSIYNLQNIPFGGENVKSNTDKIPPHFRIYFAGNFRCSLSHSKFKKGSSLMQSSISSKGLLSSKNQSAIQTIKGRLTDLIRTSANLKNQRTSIEVKLREKELQFREESQIIKQIQRMQNELKQKTAIYERQKLKVESLRKEIEAYPDMKRELREFGEKALQEIMQLQKNKVDALFAVQNAMTDKTISKSKMIIFKQENEELENVIVESKGKVKNAEAQIDAICNKIIQLKRDLSKKLAEALKLTNNFEPENKSYEHFTVYKSFPNVIEELRDIISDLSGRLDCMDNVNPEIVQEYDEKRKTVEQIQLEIDSSRNRNDNFALEIKTLYDKWYPIVSQVVEIINKHFGGFMQSMGYIGEVKLVHKEEYDFDSYGIEILVQYRKNVALQALNRHVQSGGERAVAIAVYTLSMQQLTHVPFRCVDEINQGMDTRNERKIFEMLVDETTKMGSAQYFFVTPKLLPQLKTNKRMSVQVVFNGRMVQAQNAFTSVI